MFFNIDAFISQISLEKCLCWSLFLKKAGLQVCNFIKKRLQHRCFLVKFTLFKISNSFTLFKDFLAMCLTHNTSLITMTSKFENALTNQKPAPTERLNINKFHVLLHF